MSSLLYIGNAEEIKKFNEEHDTSHFVGINLKAIVDGAVMDLTGNELKVLVCLASMVDLKLGICNPDQSVLAKRTGLSRKTVNTLLKSLEAKGQITRTKSSNPREKNYYSFSESTLTYDEITEIWECTEIEEPEAPHEITCARDFVDYFCAKYYEKYEERYLPNYKRECSIIKNKLIGKVTPEELKAIIDICFELYDVKWSSREYPRPTIYPLADWIGRGCLLAYRHRQKAAIKMEELENKEDDSEKFLNMFGGDD